MSARGHLHAGLRGSAAERAAEAKIRCRGLEATQQCDSAHRPADGAGHPARRADPRADVTGLRRGGAPGAGDAGAHDADHEAAPSGTGPSGTDPVPAAVFAPQRAQPAADCPADRLARAAAPVSGTHLQLGPTFGGGRFVRSASD